MDEHLAQIEHDGPRARAIPVLSPSVTAAPFRNYYFWLDAIRFGAALSVVSFHLGYWTWVRDSVANSSPFQNFFWFGWIGVEVFFVISGVVITNSASGACPMDFLKGRALRLYPAAWICATGTLLVLLSVEHDPAPALVHRFINSMLLIPLEPWIDAVYWTLSIEIAFYALIFIVLVAGQRSHIDRVAWGLTIGSATFVVYLWFRDDPDLAIAWNTHGLVWPNLLLLRHGCLFAVGIWIWIATNERMTPWRLAGLMLAVAGGSTEIYVRTREILSVTPATTESPLIPMTIWLAATFVIFVSMRKGDRLAPKSRLSRAGLRRIGLMTYPLYLFHVVIGTVIIRLLVRSGMSPWMALFATLSTVVAVSWLICRVLEPRVRRLLKGWLDQIEHKVLRPRPFLTFLFD